jgi:hypothetical protein
MAIILNGTTGITTPDITSTTSTLGALTQALDLGSTGQVVFPATQSASANANTLDDYEEGTWTPKDAVGAALTTSTPAYYRKVGSIVTITFDVTWTSSTTTRMTNLPFLNLSTHAGGAFCYSSSGSLRTILIASESSVADIYNGGSTLANPASARFIGSFVYQTN